MLASFLLNNVRAEDGGVQLEFLEHLLVLFLEKVDVEVVLTLVRADAPLRVDFIVIIFNSLYWGNRALKFSDPH